MEIRANLLQLNPPCIPSWDSFHSLTAERLSVTSSRGLSAFCYRSVVSCCLTPEGILLRHFQADCGKITVHSRGSTEPKRPRGAPARCLTALSCQDTSSSAKISFIPSGQDTLVSSNTGTCACVGAGEAGKVLLPAQSIFLSEPEDLCSNSCRLPIA